jgi:hypothetical protein
MSDVYKCDFCGATLEHHKAGLKNGWIIVWGTTIKFWIGEASGDHIKEVDFTGKHFCSIDHLLEWVKKNLTS